VYMCVKIAFDITTLLLFYKTFVICEDRNKGYFEPVFHADTQFMSKRCIDLAQLSIRRCLWFVWVSMCMCFTENILHDIS
jgi:hypothetical protein